MFLCVGAAECGSAPGEPGTNFGLLRPGGLTARLEVEVRLSASCKLNPGFEFELNAFNSYFVRFVNEECCRSLVCKRLPFH